MAISNNGAPLMIIDDCDITRPFERPAPPKGWERVWEHGLRLDDAMGELDDFQTVRPRDYRIEQGIDRSMSGRYHLPDPDDTTLDLSDLGKL